MNLHKERLIIVKDFFSGKKKGPVSLDLKITNRCNLSCVFCPFNGTSNDVSDELSKDELFSIIDDASDLGVKEVMLTGGGEPFIRKDLILGLMEKIKQKKIYGVLVTNATLISDEDVKEIINMGWDKVMISLDSPYSKVHNLLRGKKGTFERVLEAIKIFNNIKLNKNRPTLCLCPILTNLNYNQIDDLIRLSRKYGIGELFLQRLIIWNNNMRKLELNDTQLKEFQLLLPKYIKLADSLNVKNNLIDFSVQEFKQISTERCFLPITDMGIYPNGDVGFCKRTDKSFFNLKKKSLGVIWFSKEFYDFRKKISKGKKPNFCSKCSTGDIGINEFIEKNLVLKP